MNAQRKQIQSSRQFVGVTETALIIVNIQFDSSNAGNVHGLNVSMGASPAGPDETMVGRWYLAILPRSIYEDVTTRNQWISQLDTIALANAALLSSEFIWGAGSFVCGEQSTFYEKFAPKTSRNVKEGSTMVLIMVADAISGVVDDWDSAGTISLFVSS